ncbi:oxidoreductase [Hyphodiscus hymeniophilus]|uniref:Oxidoreductase n=1 Tax=Hyphodiscus hymeniophilus TaxID=353542 RepID=A0A9P6VI62_9HELO|nr:oxidoreductase [Hyphodiscus hymeniophilus]
MASLKGKVIALTGGASGIGLETAKLLASRGAILSIADINQQGLDDAIKVLPGGNNKHITTVVDVRKASEVDAWIEKTLQQLGKIDSGVNIAGVARLDTPVAQETDVNWDFMMDVNSRGVFHCMRAQLNHMKDGGSIVNAASISAMTGCPTHALYAASKAVVVSLTKSVAREVGSRNIRVNSVAPGTVKTPLLDSFEKKWGHKTPTDGACFDRQAHPLEIANVFAFLVSDDASFVTGTTYLVDGGFMA